MKYIQSFYQYPVTFSSIGKTIPARSAQGDMKNIAEVTEKELERLRNCEPFFRELESKKKLRVLNKIPSSYIPPAVQVNNAQEAADKANAEADRLRAQLEEAKAKLAAIESADAGVSGKTEEAKTADAEKTDTGKKKGKK